MMINEDEDSESLSINKKNFGLWVKLKIPNGKRDDDDEEEEEGTYINGDLVIKFKNKNQMKKYSNNKERVCHVCGKAFSSGKALGGHMRIHVQSPNKNFKKQNSKLINFVKPICMICGKDFPSMKSLFGHMRCHPERNWRGIHPPSPTAKNPTTPSSSSSSLSNVNPPNFDEKNRAVDLTQSLMRWPVTAKRGRKGTAAGSSLSSDDDDQLRDAVNYLMMLSKGQDFCESDAKILENVDPSNHGNEHKGSNEVGKAGMFDLVHGESVNNHFSDDQINSKKIQDSTEFKVLIKNKIIKKRKKMKLCDLKLSANPISADKYRCNKFGLNVNENNQRDIILNNFSTPDQARDDHKTSNDSGLVEARSTDTSHMGYKVFDIDLNEVPPLEDEPEFGSELACSW